MSAPVRIQSKKRGVWFEELPQRLSDAVAAYSLAETGDWAPLAELSSQTLFEGVEVHGDDAVIDDGKLIAPATVYVTLQYDPNSGDGANFHDSYPARVYFSVNTDEDGEKVVSIENIDVDTSSFFES